MRGFIWDIWDIFIICLGFLAMGMIVVYAQHSRPIPLHQADELQLRSNDFAQTYNVWALQMQGGMLDLTQMRKVESKFKRLTKAKGWPRGD